MQMIGLICTKRVSKSALILEWGVTGTVMQDRFSHMSVYSV